MKKLKYASCEVVDVEGNTREYSYYFLVEELETPGVFLENYGVSVEDSLGGCETICGISSSLDRVEALMSLLVKHQVSPIHCADVVADWL